jgi:two-component system, NtrC family, nitrogen regulation response regulator GlnG
MERLIAHEWPGNVRELENEIKRAMVMSRENVLPDYLFDLNPRLDAGTPAGGPARLGEAVLRYLDETLAARARDLPPFDHILAAVEKTLIEEALRRTGGNQVHAGDLLGMNRSTLRKKKADHGV